MKYEVRENTKKDAVIALTFTQEEFEAGIKKAYNKNKGKFNIPGFRKGKAPQKMIEQFYGAGVFYEDAINGLIPEAYEEAYNGCGLDIVSKPEFDIDSIEEGKGLVLTAKVVLKPEVTVKEYKGIKAVKNEYNLTDAEVDAEINVLKERNARMIEVEDRAVKEGDTANINYEGFCDGVAFAGGKAEGHDLVIGSNSFIPGFEEQLIGKNKDEEFDINVKFPEEYHAEDLKGKDAIFKIKINKITVKEYPELDDEFAKDVSEFDTFDELKKDVERKLKESGEARAKADFENNVLNELIKVTEAEIPDCMIEDKIEQLASDFNYRLQQQGLDPKLYLQYTGMTEDSFKEQFKDRALEQVKLSLALEEIAKAEKLEVTDEDYEAKISEMAESYKMETEQLKKFINADDMKKDMLFEKSMNFVVENAVATKEKKTAAKKPAAKKEDSEKKETAAKKTTTTKKTTETAAKKTTTAKKTTGTAAKKTTTAKKTTATKKATKTEE